MDILTSDTTLNISNAYLDPGPPFGGPCLHKDIRTLTQEMDDVALPVITAILKSNRRHGDWIVSRFDEENIDTVGIIGLTYKPGFNSAEQSPALSIAERLEQNGIDVVGHDPDIAVEHLEHASIDQIVEQVGAIILFHAPSHIAAQIRSDFNGPLLDLSSFTLPE